MRAFRLLIGGHKPRSVADLPDFALDVFVVIESKTTGNSTVTCRLRLHSPLLLIAVGLRSEGEVSDNGFTVQSAAHQLTAAPPALRPRLSAVLATRAVRIQRFTA